MSEGWTEQRARLELMTMSEADYVMGDRGRAAIREALRRLDLLQGHLDDMLHILEPGNTPEEAR